MTLDDSVEHVVVCGWTAGLRQQHAYKPMKEINVSGQQPHHVLHCLLAAQAFVRVQSSFAMVYGVMPANEPGDLVATGEGANHPHLAALREAISRSGGLLRDWLEAASTKGLVDVHGRHAAARQALLQAKEALLVSRGSPGGFTPAAS